MEELKKRLAKVGLRTQHWLRGRLGIISAETLKHLRYEDYLELECEVEHPWEKQALRTQLNIPESRTSMKQLQEERLETLKKRQEQAKSALKELKDMQERGRSRHEEAVRKKEEELRQAMDIASQYWSPAEKPLTEVLENIHKQLHLMEESISQNENLPDEEVLRWASGGLALQGIYKTKQLADMVEKREQLINIPEGFQLFGPEEGPVFEKMEFTSSKAESTFTRTMEMLGLCISLKVKGGFGGFSAEASSDDSQSEQSEETHQSRLEHTYICTTQYSYIPLASCYLPQDQLRLSNAALQELKEMEQLLSHTPAPDQIKMLKSRGGHFFQRFGSHVNQGPLHLGGIFWWKASSEGFRAEQLDEVKKETSAALSSYVGGSYSGFGWNIAAGATVGKSGSQASFQGRDRKQTQTEIQLSVTKTGGPPKIPSFAQWQAGLVSSNRTWSVIDRGSQLIPVWEIILSNHRQDFRDAHQFSRSLREAYEALTQLSVSLVFGEELASVLDEARSFLQEMKSWEVTEDDEQLAKLINFKQRLTEKTKNYSAWINIFLSEKGLQDFLKNTVSRCKDLPEENTLSIKTLLRSLLEPHIYSVSNFPESSSIMQWIFHEGEKQQTRMSTSEFGEFIQVLQEMKDYIQDVTYDPKSSAAEVREAKIKATLNVNLALSSFLQALKQKMQPDTELLLLSIAASAGYRVESDTFQHLLGCPEINFLLREMQTAREEYLTLRDLDVPRAQAFLLLTGLTVTAECKDVSPEEKNKRLVFMKRHMGNSLSPEVSNVLRTHSACTDWDTLERDLSSLRNGDYGATNDDLKNQGVIKELEDICQGTKASDHSKSNGEGKSSTGKMHEATENQEFLTLLKRLGIESYYPRKMGTADFHVIYKNSFYNSQPSTERELPLYFLQKLLMVDYRVRYLVCKDDNKAKQGVTNTLATQDSESSGTFDDFLIDLSDNIKEPTANLSHVHPMDIQMAIFHCADDFMRQYLSTKLILCQFALPLLVPNPCTSQIEFPLWSLSQVTKSWKHAEKSGVGQIKNYSNTRICQVATPVVSFMRIGNSSSSKSQILNALLTRQKHDIFFHRHCKGSSKDCLLMKGVVEIFWYCPGGRDDDRFDNCITFTNLHGDARRHEKQVRFLQEMSCINVVLLSDVDQKDERGRKLICDLWESQKPLICLFAEKENVAAGISRQNIRIAIKNRNEAELIDELTRTIIGLLAGSNITCSLEKCGDLARQHGFVVDEDTEECTEAKKMAQTLMTLLNKNHLHEIKSKLLPLQGKLWHTWCEKDKELTRLQNKRNRSIEQHRSQIESDKYLIRRKQLETSFPLNDLMKSVLNFLQRYPEATKKYFLQWMKIFLDDLSSDCLAKLHQEYHRLWSQILEMKKKEENNDLRKSLLNDFEALSDKINDSTIGLEHILREIGQIYEALDSTKQKNELSLALPQIAADLMVSGYPIELMDGDASYVPLKWVGAVLDKLIEKLGDKKMFVLSVLGIQSTGKSTLLNAMFGLQFNVSAGRCTRGAFMQLIKVDESFQQDLKFGYFLVVDTEGLRALEITNKLSLNHDNELATFVIGVGNMTVINIFGENPAEMQDVLQITVQAFLRMKQVKLNPSCLFVHQNVGEIAAKEKNMEGRRRLQERLDEMTVTAAQQEFCDVRGFSDVIQFDVNSHVHYFTHLWEGDPPMAPPNPSYSQNVQELKSKILLAAKNECQGRVLKLSELKVRISDLWNALLNENFVFSFKNTLEIATYKKLEIKYSQWTWQLRSCILDLQMKLTNQIRNGDVHSRTRGSLEEKIQGNYDVIIRDLEGYFREDKDSTILIQWKVSTQLKLNDLKASLITETERKSKRLIELKKNQNKLDERKSEYENELFKRSKELALSLKGQKLGEEELRENFNSLWSEWVTEVSSNAPRTEDPDINVDIENIFLEHFKQPDTREKIMTFPQKRTFSVDFDKHIKRNTKWVVLSYQFNESDKHNIQQVTGDIIECVKTNIDEKEELKMDYSPTYFHAILHEIGKGIKSFESNNSKYTFNNEYNIDLSLYLCKMAAERFQNMHEAFKKANDPTVYLESKRENFFKCFQISCQGATSTTTFADFLCSKLSAALPQAVYDRTAIDIATEMRSNHPTLNGNRSKLETYILKSLAEEENFEKYRQYIDFPRDFLKNFIKKCVDDYCLDKKDQRLKNFLAISLDSLQTCVISAICVSTQVVKDRNGNVSLWLDEFCRRLGDVLVFPRSDLKSIEHQETDIEFLKEAMSKALDPVLEKLKKDFAVIDMEPFKKKPHEILAEQLSGCWEQCPFCKAVCTNTIANHDGDHSVPFHRPHAITGGHWYKTNYLVTDICSSLVASDCRFVLDEDREIPYRNYRQPGPPYSKWSITPDTSVQPYWKWFVCHFRTELENQYCRKFENRGEIPSEWKKLTKQDVLSELEKELN